MEARARLPADAAPPGRCHWLENLEMGQNLEQLGVEPGQIVILSHDLNQDDPVIASQEVLAAMARNRGLSLDRIGSPLVRAGCHWNAAADGLGPRGGYIVLIAL